MVFSLIDRGVIQGGGGGGEGGLGISPHHTQYAVTGSPEEISRIKLEDDEKLVVNRLQIELLGGGSNPKFRVDVYDENADEVLADTSGLLTKSSNEPIGESEPGSDVLVRVDNQTGVVRSATITGLLDIVDA